MADGTFDHLEVAHLRVTGTVSIELPDGRIFTDPAITTNGIIVESTSNDPPEVRFASPFGGLMKICASIKRAIDGKHEEVAALQFKIDERERGTGVLSGEATLHLRDGSVPNADQGMHRVFELRSDTTGLPGADIPESEELPGDGFAVQVRIWYRDLLLRPVFPYASDVEINGHRGNPGGLDGVRAVIVNSAEYQQAHRVTV